MAKERKKGLDYNKIKQPLKDTISAMENMIKREWPPKYEHLGAAQTIFFMWVKMAKITFKTIIFISQSKLEADLDLLELCLSIPPLTRCIYDTLFNMIYVSDKIEERSLDFWKSGWKDVVDYQKVMGKYYKDFEQTEESKSLRVREKETLDMHKITAHISLDEEKGIKKIKTWPLAHGIKDTVRDRDAKVFLVFLYDCYQKRLAAHTHQSWMGLAARSFFFDEFVNQEQRRWILPDFKTDWLLLSITLLLALLSEINSFLGFGREQNLQTLWFIVKEYSYEAAKFFDMRYSQLLAVKK